MFKKILNWLTGKKPEKVVIPVNAYEHNLKLMAERQPEPELEVKMVFIYPAPVKPKKEVPKFKDWKNYTKSVDEVLRKMGRIA